LKKKKKKKRGEVFSDNKWGSYYQGMKFGGEIFLIIRVVHNT
jgi:hypothetical protein